MRKVTLPPDSPRGGLLSQAAIHKITANGTTSSPVPRGNFVLTNLLGQPAPPPPPGVAGLEPDTRGTTTVREQLSAHRSMPVCASCHTRIDPPGFALEEFDPVGGHRTNYRVHGGFAMYDGFSVPMPFKEGLVVDASGITPEGTTFSGYRDYLEILKSDYLEQVARHFTSQLIAFGTGAEVSFSDRAVVEKIIQTHSDAGYPVQSLIVSVVDSSISENDNHEGLGMKTINRRSFLRGTGVVLALPLLDIMGPQFANASSPTRRMINICCTLGLYRDSWMPKDLGRNYTPSEYLSIIDRHREKIHYFFGAFARGTDRKTST